MASSYYDKSDKAVTPLTIAKANDLNSINDAVDAAFILVESAFDNIEDLSVDRAEAWAENPEDQELDLGEGNYSALHHSAKASAQRVLAETARTGSQAAQGLAEAARDAAVLARNAAQLAETNAETAETNAETAETNAETAQGLAEGARDAAVTAQGLAEDARDKAEEWAEEDEDVAVEVGQYSAKHWAAKAAASVENPDIDTLTNDSMADTLHRHSELSASDGTPNPAVQVDAGGAVTMNYALTVTGISTFNDNVSLGATKTISFSTGASINEFSTDGDLAGNSDTAVPTEKAVKTYVDAQGTDFASELEAEAGTETAKAIAPDTLAAVIIDKQLLGMSEYIHVQHQKTSGTAGGGSSAGMNDITLNAEVGVSTLAGASLASNEVTLPAGTYYAEASAAAFSSGVIRLFLTDDANAIKLSGVVVRCNEAAKSDGGMASVSGVFTLASGDDVKLRMSTSATQATNGLGDPSSDGQTEVYADLKIWRVA